MNICDTNNCDSTIPARYVPFGFTVAATWQPNYFTNAARHLWNLLKQGADALDKAGFNLGEHRYGDALDLFEDTKVIPRNVYHAAFAYWEDLKQQDAQDEAEAAYYAANPEMDREYI